jgi:hypothetical protein
LGHAKNEDKESVIKHVEELREMFQGMFLVWIGAVVPWQLFVNGSNLKSMYYKENMFRGLHPPSPHLVRILSDM